MPKSLAGWAFFALIAIATVATIHDNPQQWQLLVEQLWYGLWHDVIGTVVLTVAPWIALALVIGGSIWIAIKVWRNRPPPRRERPPRERKWS